MHPKDTQNSYFTKKYIKKKKKNMHKINSAKFLESGWNLETRHFEKIAICKNECSRNTINRRKK